MGSPTQKNAYGHENISSKIKKTKQVLYAVPTNDAYAHFGLTPRDAVHIEKKNFSKFGKRY